VGGIALECAHTHRRTHSPGTHAHRELDKYELLVVVDVRLPVAQFGYR